MISRLGNLLRSTLNTPEVHLIPLADELASVKEYLDIEQVRFGSQLRIEFIIGDSTLIAEVPRLLLQPLVENAVRHGIAQCESGGTIVVSAELRNELRDVSTTLRHMLTEFSEFFHVSWTGLLIHASVGTAGGLGALRTKRSG
jgi:LytS/YehU family sensor histidine kinase